MHNGESVVSGMPALYDPSTSLPEQAEALLASWLSGTMLHDASYTKLREISLTDRDARLLGARAPSGSRLGVSHRRTQRGNVDGVLWARPRNHVGAMDPAREHRRCGRSTAKTIPRPNRSAVTLTQQKASGIGAAIPEALGQERRLTLQPVPHLRHDPNVPRPALIVLQLAAQRTDVRVDRAPRRRALASPHFPREIRS